MRSEANRPDGGDEGLPRVIGPAAITPEQRDADEWVESGLKDALPRVRELARQWGTTVTALTGLFGAGSLVSGDQAVRALPIRWRVAYGGVGLAALTAAAVSILTAALASQATVTVVSQDLDDRAAQRRQRIAVALLRLRWSRVSAAVALVLAVAALALRWYAPR